jgi:acetyltransferase-like isoleucine patch superfamily enzyme
MIHSTALVEDNVSIGQNTSIWHFVHVRSGAKIGSHVSIGRDCFIDMGVTIGDHARVQNGVSIYRGVALSNYVFVGPHVVFTNDMYPRASVKKWDISSTQIMDGAAIGAGAIIRCGVKIGAFSLVAAGALVTKDVEPFTLVTGFTATPKNRICACGRSHFEFEDTNWKKILPCCREYLTDELIAVAENVPL